MANDDNYTINVTPSAKRDLERLARDVLRRLDRKIQTLVSNPRPFGAVKLTNEETLYRVRVGDYRIVYQVNDGTHVVTIVRVRKRGEVYNNL